MKKLIILWVLICISLVACVSIATKQRPVASSIRINSIGFLPDMKKRASIAVKCSTFDLKKASNNKVVYSGTVMGPVYSSDTEENVYTADFTSFTETGTYYLDVHDVGYSAQFSIKTDVYNEVFKTLMLGMYLWRSGIEISAAYKGDIFAHKASHLEDAYASLITKEHKIIDGTGGWYDAGDYGKYIINAGVTVGMMFKAWELYKEKLKDITLDIPEQGGTFPDYLDELKWEMDWVLKMQYPDGTGRVSHKITNQDFSPITLPENCFEDRYFVPYSSAATADFVAMCAIAARIYDPYDPAYAGVCLNAAKVSYNFLVNNPEDHLADQSKFRTGEYNTSDPDDRLWAAAEMWETTGEKIYLDDFEARAFILEKKILGNFDWSDVGNLGIFTYLMSQREGRNPGLVNQIKKELVASADEIIGERNKNAYGRPLGKEYYWGCNGGVARQTIILYLANTVSSNEDYLNTALDAIGHLFGRNYYGRSYVTGVGFNPPKYPHDRRSGGDEVEAPWPGYLVGGGHTAKGWNDIEEDYRTNEIAINWNSALIFALSPFLEE